MSIFSADSSIKEKKFSLWRALLKQLLIAATVSSIVLAAYLAITRERDTDKTIGKHAYIGRKKEYLGKIVWHGLSTKKGIKIFQIKQPGGEIIEVADSYVEVRDNPPPKD
jgi:hypothetical protein